MFDLEEAEYGTKKLYLAGLILSVVLTLLAYFTVTAHSFSRPVVVALVVGFGTLQAMAQFFFFLHLNREAHPRWNLMVFLFMALMLVVLVVGSLWIMYNLDYRMMAPSDKGFG